MNNESTKNDIEPSEPKDPKGYIQIASEIAEGPSGSRAGFGAFRHFTSIYHNSVNLVFESNFYVQPEDHPWHIMDRKHWHFFFDKWPYDNHRVFIREILSTPNSYNPSCLWTLFWALAKAEHEFLFRYIPFWSHEERLTGHLVSQMIERLEEFAPHWTSLSIPNEDEPKPQCRIFYADTATDKREAITGADLGLIIHARFSKQREFFKVVRFQAKKKYRDGSAKIDLDQTEALMKHSNLGYYLFYHSLKEHEWSLPPTVLPAYKFNSAVEERRKEISSRRGEKLGVKPLPLHDDGYDLATFITFAVTDPASEHGIIISNPSKAVSILMSHDQALPRPTRIMIVTLGGGTTSVDWHQLLSEYIGFGFDEEQ